MRYGTRNIWRSKSGDAAENRFGSTGSNARLIPILVDGRREEKGGNKQATTTTTTM
jgi:hypothetical protein